LGPAILHVGGMMRFPNIARTRQPIFRQ